MPLLHLHGHPDDPGDVTREQTPSRHAQVLRHNGTIERRRKSAKEHSADRCVCFNLLLTAKSIWTVNREFGQQVYLHLLLTNGPINILGSAT